MYLNSLVCKQMTEKQVLAPKVENLSTITVSNLTNDSTTDFDLFIKTSNSFTLYAPAPYHWLEGEIDRLQKQGHAALYYFTKDSRKVEAYEQLSKLPSVDMNAAPHERILNLTEVGMELTRVLYDYPLTQASMGKAHQVANQMVETISEDISCVAALGKLANHDYYTYYHSARVSAYAVAIAAQMSLTDTGKLNEIAVGCLLHDIGKSKVDLTVINKPGKLSTIEFQLMRQHPVYGDELVQSSLLSAVPRGIILHHHERLTGDGYPHQLTEHEILKEVRIASFADVFDALTTNRPYQISRTKFEAMDLIRFKLLDTIDKDVFRAMVEILNDHNEKKKL